MKAGSPIFPVCPTNKGIEISEYLTSHYYFNHQTLKKFVMTMLPSSSYQRACNIHMQIHSLLCFIFKNSPKNKIYQYLQIPLISPFNSRLTKSHCLGIEHISTFRRTSSVQELSWLNWIFDGRKWSTKRL